MAEPISLLTIVCLALLITTGACLWLWSQRQALRTEYSRLERDLADTQTHHQTMTHENTTLLRDLAVLRSQQQALKEQHDHAQQQARETFKSLAADALKHNNEQFLHLAGESFKTEQAKIDQTRQKMQHLVEPINKTLKDYNQSLQEVEKGRREAYGSLTNQVKTLADSQQTLRQETANLVTALRRPEVRGKWGEISLRRVVELAGMTNHCDFEEQTSVQTDGGNRLKPDLVVCLPSDRRIVVDAKTPLDAFLNAVDADRQDQRDTYLEQHTHQIETKIKDLAGKDYHAQFERSPDFVVLFIPGESFLFPATQRKPQLIENALEKGVVIATPTTLISLLKVIALGWREEKIAENAQRISDLGRELHDRLRTATNHLVALGRALGHAVGTYNDFVGSFDTRVLTSARRFEEFGAASTKALPGSLSPIEKTPRQPKDAAPESPPLEVALPSGYPEALALSQSPDVPAPAIELNPPAAWAFLDQARALCVINHHPDAGWH